MSYVIKPPVLDREDVVALARARYKTHSFSMSYASDNLRAFVAEACELCGWDFAEVWDAITLSTYTVTSAKDSHVIEVFDGIAIETARMIADTLLTRMARVKLNASMPVLPAWPCLDYVPGDVNVTVVEMKPAKR